LFRLWNLSGDEDWKAIWKRQCKDFLSAEVFWVVCPWGKDPEKVLKATEKYLPEDTKDKPDYWFNRFKSLYDKAKSSRTDIGLAYPLLLGRTRQLLTARKNLRHFRQSEERGEPGHKCSMCGVREALHPEWWRIDEKGGHYHELREFWSALTKVTKPKKLAGRIRRGDRLCAVCAVKRLALEAHFAESLGFDHHMFPSTSTVATATFQMEVVENIEQLQEEVGKYVEAMKPIMEEITYPSSSLPLLKAKSEEYPNSRIKQLLEDFLQIDGDWFFEESFDIESVEWEYGRRYRRRIEQKKLQEELQKKLSEAKEALKELVKAAGELGIGKPNPYYAMICMDGDHIGDWQTGRKNLEFEKLLHQDALNELRDIAGERRPMGPGTQGALCTALGNFALKIVRPLVEKEHCGKLIYAGGEDVLAFAPLRDVPGILEGLQEKLVINFLQKDGEILLLPGEKASISAGVVIAHRSQPLSQVVEESRKALKEHAKEMLGRDALAFHLMRRSGESTKIGVCWRFPEDARADPPMSILKDLIQWFRGFREGKLSPRLAWDMDQEAGGLRALTEVDPREARLRWLINRHTDPKTPQDEARALTKKMTGLLRGYTRFINERGLSDELNAWELTKDFILVAHFIAKEP
jgi:CRISPR-associated protein Cmr2